jgi:hypothetical protein
LALPENTGLTGEDLVFGEGTCADRIVEPGFRAVRVAEDKACNSTSWFEEFQPFGRHGLEECIAFVQSDPGRCNQNFFVYAHAGEGRCGCIDMHMRMADCGDASNHHV